MLLLFVSHASATDNQLQKTLTDLYKSHAYTLRVALKEKSQQFDESGQPAQSATAPAPWTVYSRLEIHKVKLQNGKLLMKGQRIGWVYKNDRFVAEKLHDDVTFTVALPDSATTPEQIHEILSRIFAFSKEDFISSMSPFWRDYVESHLQAYSDDGNTMEFKPIKELLPKPDINAPEADENGIYRVGGKVKPPVPRYTPDPPYDLAREMNITGPLLLTALLDEHGKISSLKVVRPLGMGLDETASNTVSKWSFDPASREGQPVRVRINVEIEFHEFNLR